MVHGVFADVRVLQELFGMEKVDGLARSFRGWYARYELHGIMEASTGDRVRREKVAAAVAAVAAVAL